VIRTLIGIAVIFGASPAFGLTCTGPYCFEAEQGSFGGASFQSSKPGYSGGGYISFENDSTSSFVQVSANVPPGLYELWIGYNSPHGFKGYDYLVNQMGGSGGFDGNGNQFGADRAGLFNLTQSNNTLRLNRGWGWYNVDYFELRPFTPPAILPVSSQLSDELADNNTRVLMNYLTSIYGQKTLAGHQHDESKNLNFPSQTYLNLSGGLRPAVRSSDFMEYSPSRIEFGANPRNETEESIEWAKSTGGIVSMTWHWNAPANLVNTPCGSNCGPNDYPWWRGFYTQGTTFDLAGALANPGSNDHTLLLRDIDAIGVELKKFQDEGIPVIWRPLHEVQGNATDATGNGAWFWWGADGPTAFKDLWRLMHNRLTTPRPEDEFPGLHNLIWEFTSSAAQSNHLDWYPGDDVVDMVGLDIYTNPSSSMSGEWYDVLAHYNGRKMIALSESGTLPNADAMDLYGINWSYFSLWKDGFLDDFTAQQVQALLNDEDIITLNELPTMPWSNAAPAAGDYNDDGNVDAADFVVWRKGLANLLGDYANWRARFGSNSGSGGLANGEVPEPSSAGMLLVVAALCIACRRRPL
jgi:mannan endo-1,4-beta-mannosidase